MSDVATSREAVMTASAQRTALNWLDSSIERYNSLTRTSGSGEQAEILETVRGMLAERDSLVVRLAAAEKERDEYHDAIRREVTASNLSFLVRKAVELETALAKANAEIVRLNENGVQSVPQTAPWTY